MQQTFLLSILSRFIENLPTYIYTLKTFVEYLTNHKKRRRRKKYSITEKFGSFERKLLAENRYDGSRETRKKGEKNRRRTSQWEGSQSLQIRFLEGEIEKDRSPRCVVGANGFYHRVRPYPGVFYLKPGTRKKQPWTRLRRVSRVKVGWVFVRVCVCRVCMRRREVEGGGKRVM